jgi:imidazole glycerol-phosphate synthase subunit HisH
VSTPAIAVVDYGMGNLRSVEKALARSGARPEVTSDPGRIESADGIVLPGVGAFPKAMRNLRERGLDALLIREVSRGRPLLGICLGMQLLFEASTEMDGSEGLGLIGGRVERLPAPNLKVPLIGWTAVSWRQHSALIETLPNACPFYFVHSYAPADVDEEDQLGVAEYGTAFTCAVERGNLYGVQFHPEKSSAAGLKLLENFAGTCARVGAPS